MKQTKAYLARLAASLCLLLLPLGGVLFAQGPVTVKGKIVDN